MSDGSRFAVGTEYRWRGKLWHVRAIVDDDYMVVRWWSKKRQTWVYEVEEIEIMAAVLKWPDSTPTPDDTQEAAAVRKPSR